MTEQFNSEWFLAAQTTDARFIVTQGICKTSLQNGRLHSEFYFSEESRLYLTLAGPVGQAGEVDALATSGDPEVPEFEVNGQIFEDDESNSVVMTDGWTTISIACKPKLISFGK